MKTKKSRKHPLVSVIIPAYNSEKFLEQTLHCVFEQDYENIEIIVVDDGSTDGTSDILKKYNGKIITIYQPNSGPAAARNKGVKNSNGEYIAFIDSDDLWTREHLKRQVCFLEANQEYSVVFSNFSLLIQNADDTFPDICLESPKVDKNCNTTVISGWVYHKILFNSLVHIITSVMKRSLFEKLNGFKKDLPRGEDYDFWIRASRLTPFAKCKNKQAFYRIHNSSITAEPAEKDYFFEVVKNAVDVWGLRGPDGSVADKDKLRRHFANSRFSHGYAHFYKGSPDLAIKSFIDSIQYYPLRVKPWGYLILSFCKKIFLALPRP